MSWTQIFPQEKKKKSLDSIKCFTGSVLTVMFLRCKSNNFFVIILDIKRLSLILFLQPFQILKLTKTVKQVNVESAARANI